MQSLWKIPDVSGLRSPGQILREQADLLSQQTSGYLTGIVNTSGSGDELITDFYIQVPTLNNYTYSLLKYFHKITAMYPGRMYFFPTGTSEDVFSEDGFVNRLAVLLGSEETGLLIKSLLAQAIGT